MTVSLQSAQSFQCKMDTIDHYALNNQTNMKSIIISSSFQNGSDRFVEDICFCAEIGL